MTIVGRLQSENFKNYFASVKYSLYTMRRPLDGFWDLIHEKRGSLAAAHTFVVAMIFVDIIFLILSNFQFIPINMEFFNAAYVVSSIVLPMLLFSVANWCLTTLFDGKGRITDIYMAYAYAMVPQILIRLIYVPISHAITYDEGMILSLLLYLSEGWFYLLIICAMMQIHDYSFGKAILTTILSLAAMAIMVFIFLMFFAVVSDGLAYFYSLGQEAMFRIRRG